MNITSALFDPSYLLHKIGRIFFCVFLAVPRRTPFDSSHLPQKPNGGHPMKTINRRDYDPLYTQDTLMEVSDEDAQAIAGAEGASGGSASTSIKKGLAPGKNI